MEICKHNDYCGGCIHQGIPYEKQVEMKGREVLKLLTDKKIVCKNNLGIVGSPKQYAYRNKMEYTFGDMVKDGEMTLGMHQKGRFMSIVTVDECQLVDPDFNLILRETLDFCNEKGYRFYHKKSHEGLMRNLIIRKGERTNELLINIVTSSQEEFAEEAFVERMQSLELSNELVGILRTLNDGLSDAVYCDELKTLWGRDSYMEKIMGLDFKVSAFSFFQTNIEAVERLYTDALSLIEDVEGKTVFDLFCGTGTITQALALRAKLAIGVELVEEAVEAAKVNAQLNGLDNCKFIAGDVFAVLDNIEEKPDVIVVDPPRVGIQNKALDKIIAYGVKQIVYVSCNPKTLAMNLEYLQFYGYEVKSLKAYDNFPMTKHTECVCLLER
ncbi:23S rRNA (uracil(1939)-C(5))-methyltransferase RlmD [Clostridium aminobutyricum]|uniref:23S rRNA (Uracil(1939)-C(5))-methyltransferase RlmD n=1 Tax=Clostridium aminobutyricum TaxID=33953 RepID=A0A939D7S7_CLOAM|nr:23S rRNA (uracil(1939)-C(5))-methyltransferase RlmD [Clostridium aminobutyricum]MBN7772657.1 23S rRNA (uracil(1939)-C(5))-methyltransferase RlmD [Clostridium aminobutyricum]